eukprot:60539-Chlamydomonas_euryale.AAC.4
MASAASRSRPTACACCSKRASRRCSSSLAPEQPPSLGCGARGLRAAGRLGEQANRRRLGEQANRRATLHTFSLGTHADAHCPPLCPAILSTMCRRAWSHLPLRPALLSTTRRHA